MKSRLLLLLLFLCSRLALGLGIAALASGHEISDDAAMHRSFAERPWKLLLGTEDRWGLHPPLMGFLEWPSIPLAGLFGEFVGLRLTYVAWEAVTLGLFSLCLKELKFSPSSQAKTLLWLIACPTLWLTSIVQPNDEIISAAVCTAFTLFILRKQALKAFAIGVFGVVAAKVFFVVPTLVVASVLLHQAQGTRGKVARQLGLILSPLVLLEVGRSVVFLNRLGEVPLLSFSTSGYFSVNFWGATLPLLSPPQHQLARSLALVLSLMCTALVASLCLRRNEFTYGSVLPASCAALLTFFATFYVSNPEYLALVVPPLLILFSRTRTRLLLFATFGFSWFVNLSYALAHKTQHAASAAQGKATLLTHFGTELAPWKAIHVLSCLLFTGLLLYWAHRCTNLRPAL